MASLPSNVNYGSVVGQFIASIMDGPDANRFPDSLPLGGEITFTPSVAYVKNVNTTPNPVTIVKTVVTGILDAEGYLCTPVPDSSGNFQRGVFLVATDDPDLNPRGWTWTVDYRFTLEGRPVASPARHSISVPTDTVVDLTTASPVPASVGNVTVIGPAGPAGPTGLSAYESAVKNGFQGTEAQWLNAIVSNSFLQPDPNNPGFYILPQVNATGFAASTTDPQLLIVPAGTFAATQSSTNLGLYTIPNSNIYFTQNASAPGLYVYNGG